MEVLRNFTGNEALRVKKRVCLLISLARQLPQLLLVVGGLCIDIDLAANRPIPVGIRLIDWSQDIWYTPDNKNRTFHR